MSLPMDNATFTALWERYHGEIYAYAVRQSYHQIGGHHIEPDDIVQETFLSAARAWHRFDGSNVAAWLYRIAANECLDLHRRNQRIYWAPWEPEKHDQLQAEPAEAERSVIRAETIAAVRAAIAQVSPRHRQALVLYEVAGLSCEEIGRRMGVSRSAIKSMLHRARGELGRIWRRMEAERVA